MNTQIRLFFSIFLISVASAIHADVNPDGSFSHTIPIEIPAGRNGLQPKLALTYNSNSGNGMLGMGWALSGLPAITRMNYGNGINYGKAGFPADTFVGPEGRLIELGNGTGTYHPETETWSKYEASGNCGNGPCTWKVTDRNGLVYQYGLTSNSRIVAKDANNNDINNGAIRVWALERVEDLNGNYYEITYKKDSGFTYDNGQYYPEKISYTLGYGVSKNYAISFFYDESSRPDKDISYAQSAYVQTNWRLTKIAVDYQSSCFLLLTCNDRVRSYILGYDLTASISNSRVISWQEFDSNNLALPATTFAWQNDSVGFTQMGGDFGKVSLNSITSTADFNGDGKADIIGYGPDGATYLQIRYSTPSGFSTWSADFGKYSAYSQVYFADIDGDGKTDIIDVAPDGGTYVIVRFSTGNGFTLWSSDFGAKASTTAKTTFADIDGDGKADLISYAPDGSNFLYIKFSTGSGFTSWTQDYGKASNYAVVNLADMNGDGKADLVSYAPDGGTYFQVRLSTGNGLGNWSADYGVKAGTTAHTGLVDVNGDGRADVVSFAPDGIDYLFVKLGADAGFLPWTENYFKASVNAMTSFSDYNGDGKADIISFGPSGSTYLHVKTGSGTGLAASTPDLSKATANSIIIFADVDGDGKADQIAPGIDGYGMLYVATAIGQKGNMLTTIVGSTSSSLTVKYNPAPQHTNAICMQNNPCTSPDSSPLTYTHGIPNPAPRYVVTQVTTTSNMDLDGAGGNDTFTTNYDYYNGRMTTGTIPERANLGFEKIKTTDVTTGSYKIDTYRQDKPFHGRPLRTASYLANGTKVSETTFPALAQYYCDESGCNTYNALPVTTPTQPQQIRPKLAAQLIGGESSATISTSFENGIAYAAKTEEVLSYDVYGNALSARQTVDGNGATRSTYKFAQYINDTATGRTIGLPFNEKVCLSAAACAANDSNFVSESNTYFDGNATTGVVGSRKLVTKKESYLSTGAGTGVWVPEIFTYDALGNVTQKVDAQGITTTIAYDSDYKQYPLSVTRSHGSATSVTSYTYDYRFGKKLTETNHDDNLITIYSIDASGFVTSQQTQNGATILAKKSFAHSPFGTAPIWTQECTFYGATFTTTACRKKFTDALGRVYREEFPELVNGVETQRAIERRYKQNATDRREYASKPQDPAFDFTADFAALSFPGKWSESVSDNLGRATSARSHDNKTTSVSYQNAGAGTMPPGGSVACTVNTDVDGVKKRSCTDIGGKPSVVAEAYTGATETIVTYGYDSLNRLTSVSSPQGVTSITYVGRSQLQESIIDPVVGTTSYEYYLTPGAADFTKLKKETRPSTTAGTVITDLEYNAPFGRVSKSTKADSVTNYVYDETDLSYGKGRLTTQSHVVDGYTIQDRYSYNDRGETTNTTRRISHATETLCSNVNAMPCLQTFGSTKDELGRMKTMTYPDGKVSVVNYLPGSGKNVSSLTHDGITYATYSDYTFDIAPHVGKVSYGNGVEHAYTYAPETGLLNTTVIGKPAGQPYIDVAYSYNPNLNIERITDNAIPFLTVSYQYDALNRLTTATWDPDGTEITRVKNYQFDNHGAAMSKGNLTRKDQRRLTYATGKTFPVSDELWNEGASQWQANATYTWSANGNLLTKGPFTFSYDSNNMMKQAVEVDGSSAVVGDTKFFYDQSGQRFLKKHTRGGVTIKTWYLGDGIEVREKYVGVSAGTPDGTYDSSQSTKYIYGIDNKKLASVTGTVYTAALSVSSSSMYALADSHSSSTVSGVAGKVYYTFYGAYAHVSSFAHDLNHGQIRIIALTLVGLMLLVWLVLTHPLSPSLKKRGGSTTSPLPVGEGPGVRVALWQRATALGMLFAFFTVNCGSQLPPGVTQGQVDTLISDLYTGLPAGTVYYSHNHLGSGALVTDAAGNEVFRITYTEYGEIDLANSGVYNPATTNIEHTVDDAKIFITAVKYTGQEYDPETGMYYYNARYFDPQLGVFTTADSEVPEFSDSQSYNRHMYVRGNPIMYTDPTGHFFKAIGKWLSQAWEDTKDFVKKNAEKIKTIASVVFNPVAAINGGVSLWTGLNAYSHATTGNWLTADQGWQAFGAGAQAGVVISSSVAVGGYAASLTLPFANTLGIVAGSFVESSMQFAYSGGESEFRVHFGGFSLGEKGFRSFNENNPWYENVGYALGAFANFTDSMQALEKAGFVSQAQGKSANAPAAEQQTGQNTRGKKNQQILKSNNAKEAAKVGKKSPKQLAEFDRLEKISNILRSGKYDSVTVNPRIEQMKYDAAIPKGPNGNIRCADDDNSTLSMRPANACT